MSTDHLLNSRDVVKDRLHLHTIGCSGRLLQRLSITSFSWNCLFLADLVLAFIIWVEEGVVGRRTTELGSLEREGVIVGIIDLEEDGVIVIRQT